MIKFFSFFLFAVIFFLGLHYSGVAHFSFLDSPSQHARYEEGKKVPDISLPAFDGSLLRLSDYAGKVVLLHFWGTWCAPCQKEFPELIQKMSEYKEEDIVMIALSTDHKKKDVTDFLDAVSQSHGLNLPSNIKLVWDEDGKISAEVFHVTGFPETILIDRQQKMLQKVIGPVQWNEEFSSFLAKMIEETPNS